MKNFVKFTKQNNFIEMTLQHECFPVTLLYIFRTPFPKKISEGMHLIWFKTNLENSSYLVKIFCHLVNKIKYAYNPNLNDFIKVNACKRCFTQYVWMQHRLDLRYAWDKSVKKNLFFTVLKISHISWKYLVGHIHAFLMAHFSYSMLCKHLMYI